MSRPLLCSACVVLALALSAPAHAGSRGFANAGGDLKSSSGGTGLSRSPGNGGTGIQTTAILPFNKLQSTFKPEHVVAPPPAGPRPHTDLAAAEKRTNLSSQDLIKHSQLFNKVAAAVGDPLLVKPVLNKIGATEESARTFHSVPGFTAEESKGNVYPTNGGTSRERPMASLSSDAAARATEEPDSDKPDPPGWLLAWLFNLIAVAGTLGLAWWLWQNAPKGAHMSMPTTTA